MPEEANAAKKAVAERPQEATKDDFLGRFWASAKNLMDDMLSLEVATYTTTGDQEGDIILEIKPQKSELPQDKTAKYNATLQAYTRIELDADTLAVLPVTEEFVVRKEIYEIHKEHVKMAQETRQAMVKAVFDAAASLINIGG